MREPVRRERGESRDVVADLRAVVGPEPLAFGGADLGGTRWGRSRGVATRCERCRRRIRDGEPVLLHGEEACFCGLCGRRHWARRWEDSPSD